MSLIQALFNSPITEITLGSVLLFLFWSLVYSCRFLESLLNYCIDRSSISLPELQLCVDPCGSSLSNQTHLVGFMEKKNEHKKSQVKISSDNKRTYGKISKTSASSDVADGKLRQPKILDVLKKAGAMKSQELPNDYPSCLSSKGTSAESSEQHSCSSNDLMVAEISAPAKALETHRFKFRCLLVQSYVLLTFSKVCRLCSMETNIEDFICVSILQLK